MMNQLPMGGHAQSNPQMPQVGGDLPDELDANAFLTVVSVRAVITAGFAAGALVPCIPFALFGAVGIAATLLFNRGTIDFAALSTGASTGFLTPAFVFLLVVVGSGSLGAVMGAVRRWSVRRGILWKLLVGHYFSSHPGPHSVIALVAAPALIVAALHAVSVVGGFTVSIAPVFFLMFPPAWMLAGLMYESAWEALLFPMLRSRATEPMRWLLREAALFRLLKDDSYLFECRLHTVSIDAESGVARVRGHFPTPDHARRVREIGLRVVGVREVDVAAAPLAPTERLPSGT